MSASRKSLSKRTRFEVFKRDGFTCQYCGSKPPDVVLHCDHVVAVANGGTNDLTNLITSCADCNECRRRAPILDGQMAYHLQKEPASPLWPVTLSTEWCGCHPDRKQDREAGE